MVAVDGVAKVPDELKSEYRDELAGYLVKVIMARLMPYKAPVVADTESVTT